jgi:hypothetical protein
MQVQPKSPGPKEFFRAATDSLLDAKILFSASRSVGAVYLGGYCVECSLKALILFRITNSKWHIHVESFQGRKGHDLEKSPESLSENRRFNTSKYIRRVSKSEFMVNRLEISNDPCQDGRCQ